MHILHIVSSVNKVCGGVSEVVPRLAMEQWKLGHRVTVAALESNISDSMRQAISIGVSYAGNSKRFKLLPWALGFSREFKRNIHPLVKESDIVHLHGHWMYPPWCAGWLAQKLGKPYVMMPHGFLEPERLKISKMKKRIIGDLIERPLLRKADGIVATSESEVVGIRAYGVDNPIHIMPIGIDCEKFDASHRNEDLMSRLGFDLRKKHLLYFSRITPIKGLDMLAEAWERINHNDWQLVIVGPDDRGYSEVVSTLYADYIAEGSVVIRGPVFGQDKYDLLKSVDAFVLPTRSENWSIAVAEAMAAGLPVVCTKGAPWSCINNVNAGYWVDISSDGILGGLQNLFWVDEAHRRGMGANGRKWVVDNLNWREIAESLVDFYKQICEVK